MTASPRKSQLQVVHEISLQIDFSGPTSGVLGALPAGAVPVDMHVSTSVAFNSTTNTVVLGTSPGGAQYLGATDLKTAAHTVTLVGAAGGTAAIAVDTTIYFALASTGPAPTAGRTTIWLTYLPALG